MYLDYCQGQAKISVFFSPSQQEAEAVDPTPVQAKVDAPPPRRRVTGQHAANRSQLSVEGGAVIGPPAKWAITAIPSPVTVTPGQVSVTVSHTGATLTRRTATPPSPTATPPSPSQGQAPVPTASEVMPPPTVPQACLPLIVWPAWPLRPQSAAAHHLEPLLGESYQPFLLSLPPVASPSSMLWAIPVSSLLTSCDRTVPLKLIKHKTILPEPTQPFLSFLSIFCLWLPLNSECRHWLAHYLPHCYMSIPLMSEQRNMGSKSTTGGSRLTTQALVLCGWKPSFVLTWRVQFVKREWYSMWWFFKAATQTFLGMCILGSFLFCKTFKLAGPGSQSPRPRPTTTSRT